MPLVDNATFIPDGGHYYSAPVGTELPEDLLTPGAAWDEFGHTDLETPMTPTSEGGDKTVVGTLQNKKLRVKRSDRTDSFDVGLQQFDISALRLYYGSNLIEVSGGAVVGVPIDPQPVEAAFLAVFRDGDAAFAYYAPRAEIFRGGDVEMSSVEDLSTLPLSITPLVHQSNKWAYAVTPIGTPEVDPGP